MKLEPPVSVAAGAWPAPPTTPATASNAVGGHVHTWCIWRRILRSKALRGWKSRYATGLGTHTHTYIVHTKTLAPYLTYYADNWVEHMLALIGFSRELPTMQRTRDQLVMDVTMLYGEGMNAGSSAAQHLHNIKYLAIHNTSARFMNQLWMASNSVIQLRARCSGCHRDGS